MKWRQKAVTEVRTPSATQTAVVLIPTLSVSVAIVSASSPSSIVTASAVCHVFSPSSLAVQIICRVRFSKPTLYRKLNKLCAWRHNMPPPPASLTIISCKYENRQKLQFTIEFAKTQTTTTT